MNAQTGPVKMSDIRRGTHCQGDRPGGRLLAPRCRTADRRRPRPAQRQGARLPGRQCRPGDQITIDGVPLPRPERARLWRYHKPAGLVVSHKDPQGRPTVFDKLKEQLPRVVSIGRLDLNTEGLLLLTNDGELERQLELPANGWIRRYRVRVFGKPDPEVLAKLKDGVMIEGVKYGSIDAVIDKIAGRQCLAHRCHPRGQEPRSQERLRLSGAHGQPPDPHRHSGRFSLASCRAAGYRKCRRMCCATSSAGNSRRDTPCASSGEGSKAIVSQARRARRRGRPRTGCAKRSSTSSRMASKASRSTARGCSTSLPAPAPWASKPSRAARASASSSMTAEARGLIRRNADALGVIGQVKIWRRDATACGLRAAAGL